MSDDNHGPPADMALEPLEFINQFDGQRIRLLGTCSCGQRVYAVGVDSMAHSEPVCSAFTETDDLSYISGHLRLAEGEP